MGERTGIQWCDHTFNPWWGCAQVSPGCAHCYADRDAKRFGHDLWGADQPRRFFGAKHWSEPAEWNEEARKSGVRRRVFCASMADVFERHADDAVNRRLDDERYRLFAMINATPHLDWLLLTKRPENFRAMLPAPLPDNVWLGVSAENQPALDRRFPRLIETEASVLFVSAEPLLGPLDFSYTFRRAYREAGGRPAVVWVIVGGESGPGARPCDIEWVRSIVRQCRETDVPVFVKQLGSRAVFSNTLSEDWPEAGWKAGETKMLSLGLRDRKGGDPSEWPEELRVREFPCAR